MWCRIQAGQYEDAHELLNDLLKLEEESLGARTDKLADIYQLMSKTKSEVMYNTFNLLNDLLKLEEESLGARTDKLADIYQLMSKTKSEVMYNTFNQ